MLESGLKSQLFMDFWKRFCQISDLFHFGIHGGWSQPSNCFFITGKVAFKSQFKLVKQSQGGSTLFVHHLVGKLCVEGYFQKAEAIFNLVKIVYFRFFV